MNNIVLGSEGRQYGCCGFGEVYLGLCFFLNYLPSTCSYIVWKTHRWATKAEKEQRDRRFCLLALTTVPNIWIILQAIGLKTGSFENCFANSCHLSQKHCSSGELGG